MAGTPALINIGTGSDLTIAELVALVMDVVGFRGRIVHDLTKPDGTPQKLLDVGRLAGPRLARADIAPRRHRPRLRGRPLRATPRPPTRT